MPIIPKTLIEVVEPGSIAAELGVQPGDEIVSINGEILKDLIDYQFAVTDEVINVVFKRPSGEEWTAEIEKEFDDDLGIGFESAVFDGIKPCHNACVFCFVDQMAPGMRSTLYVKDDDYRLSFLYGNFITLTNLTEEDFNRITRLHLSPLYVSVHTTSPALRESMLQQSVASNIMVDLKRLVDAGIDLHTQIVLCPGLNDQEQLEQTITDLSELGPSILSIAIVPVGLTKYRDNLFPLRGFTPEEAATVIRQVDKWQQRFMQEFGDPLVYLSDEFYLTARQEIPPYDYYGDFPQIENGVGLTRMFIHKWQAAVCDAPCELAEVRKVTLVGGVSGARVLEPLLEKLHIKNLTTQFVTVTNNYFGSGVTVTGLLTGRDILRALQDADLGDVVIIPGNTLKQGTELFLDDLSVADIAAVLPVPVHIAYGPEELLDQVLGLPED